MFVMIHTGAANGFESIILIMMVMITTTTTYDPYKWELFGYSYKAE